jgi:hypothetical protein
MTNDDIIIEQQRKEEYIIWTERMRSEMDIVTKANNPNFKRERKLLGADHDALSSSRFGFVLLQVLVLGRTLGRVVAVSAPCTSTVEFHSIPAARYAVAFTRAARTSRTHTRWRRAVG